MDKVFNIWKPIEKIKLFSNPFACNLSPKTRLKFCIWFGWVINNLILAVNNNPVE